MEWRFYTLMSIIEKSRSAQKIKASKGEIGNGTILDFADEFGEMGKDLKGGNERS